VVIHLHIENGVDGNHLLAHVVRPLEQMGPDVDEKCIRRPASKDHYFRRRYIIDEEGHGCARPNRLVSNFVGIESEGGLAAKRVASVAKNVQDVSVCNQPDLAIDSDCVDGRGTGSIRDGAKDARDLPGVAQYGAEVRVARSSLCPRVHLLAVLLVNKGYCDELRKGE
jgi:hypothetical protein